MVEFPGELPTWRVRVVETPGIGLALAPSSREGDVCDLGEDDSSPDPCHEASGDNVSSRSGKGEDLLEGNEACSGKGDAGREDDPSLIPSNSLLLTLFHQLFQLFDTEGDLILDFIPFNDQLFQFRTIPGSLVFAFRALFL
jgi:hypothetical protein